MSRYSPFHNGDTTLRASDLNFTYTEEEEAEIAKISTNIFYFAITYAYVTTDDGIMQVKHLRQYQKRALASFIKHLKIVWLASRQIGKSITVGIFIVHYILTHTDRNIVLLSQNQDKVVDLMEKIRTIIKNLPFYMKPGIKTDNVMTMKFENGCSISAKTTTENSAAGITGHLIYMDEFALINPNFIKSFYRTVFPSLSSSKIAQMIITSTARGTNKFYDIYQGAIDGNNSFDPLRTDWYEVPLREDKDGNVLEYRGDAWKAVQIADLGSEEDFNQEFGNQFLAGSQLLFGSAELQKLKYNQTEFKEYTFDYLDDMDVKYRDCLKFHPLFKMTDSKIGRFVFTIDLAEGKGGDYSVINIFQLLPMTRKEIEALTIYTDERDFFKLVQIAIWRSNIHDTTEVAKTCYHLLTDMFDHEKCKVVLEFNYDGKLFMSTISNIYGEEVNDLDVDSTFVQFPVSVAEKTMRVGLTLDEDKREFGCKQIVTKVKNNQMIIVEATSVDEAISFYRNKKGKFVGHGNDDTFMSACNMAHIYRTEDYIEMVEEMMDECSDKFKEIIEYKLSRAVVTNHHKDEDGYAEMF